MAATVSPTFRIEPALWKMALERCREDGFKSASAYLRHLIKENIEKRPVEGITEGFAFRGAE